MLVMNVLTVYAHQDPQSFGAAMHSTTLSTLAANGHKTIISDLYASGFRAVAAKWDFKTSGGPHKNYMMEQKRVAEKDGGGSFAEDIRQEITRVHVADLIIFEFPLWWSAPPAVVKGWLDKVFALGIVWDRDHRYSEGKLKGKQALVVVGAGDPKESYTKDGMHRASVIQHLFPLLHSTLAQSGLDVLDPFVAYDLTDASVKDRQATLDGYGVHLSKQLTDPKFLYKNS